VLGLLALEQRGELFGQLRIGGWKIGHGARV
jgi:hypothetical protein